MAPGLRCYITQQELHYVHHFGYFDLLRMCLFFLLILHLELHSKSIQILAVRIERLEKEN